MLSVFNFLPITLEFIGTMLIGLAVLRVHTKLGKEHKIDKKVLRSIKREHVWTVTGMILITLGFILQLF